MQTGHHARISPMTPSVVLIACLVAWVGLAPEALAQQPPAAAAPQDAAAVPQPPRQQPPARKHSAFGEAMRNLTQALREASTPPSAEAEARTGPQAGSGPGTTPVEGTALAGNGTP